MRLRVALFVIFWAFVLGVAHLASSGSDAPVAVGQEVPPGQPVTTPQPTVPCTPLNGCGPSGGPGLNAFAYILRFCNGDAVPTPPGQTTFALVYGIGGGIDPALLPDGIATFFGSVAVNGVSVPSSPLDTLGIGERDVRLRQGVVGNDDVFTVTLYATTNGQPTGPRILFGNGQDVRVRSASGACPGAPVDTTVPVSTTVPVGSPTAPPTMVPPDFELPPVFWR